MKLLAFDDPSGNAVLVNVELIRFMSEDTDKNGPLTEILFSADHRAIVRGSLADTFAVIADAFEDA